MSLLDKKKKTMKRAVMDFDQSRILGQEAKAKLKFQALLNEFLKVQKEFVARKRKLRSARQKKETLFAEVLFLRRRRKYLLEGQNGKLERKKDVGLLQSSSSARKVFEEGLNPSTFGFALGKSCLVPSSVLDLRDKDNEGKEGEEVAKGILRVEKLPKNYLNNDSRLGKRKISWHDQVTVKV